MTDDTIFDDRTRSTESDRAEQDDRLSRLPDFERDSPSEIGGGVVAEGGTAGDTGTGSVVGAGSDRDLAADKGRAPSDADLPGQRSGPIQEPPEPGGSQ